MFHAVCTMHATVEPIAACERLTFDDPGLFVAHMSDEHRKRRMSPTVNSAAIRRGWRTPTPKPFEPEPLDVGTDVEWEHRGRILTGQVWSLHRNSRLRWVADGKTWHEVDVPSLRPVTQRAAA